MRRFLALLIAAAITTAAAAQETYPTRQITIVAPFPAGGSTDLVARLVSDGLRNRLGQPVIVENKPGGTGIIGTREVVKAAPDGYTLLLGNVGSLVIPAAMNPDFPIDPIRELVPISLSAEFVGVMLVKKDLPIGTLQEFIAYAKARPGVLNFGSSGVGSLVHLSAELLMQQADIKMQHVPYRGGANSMTDLLAGTLDVLFTSSPVAAGQAGNRGLKMLAVTSRYRLQALPDVPTMQEAGLRNYDVTGWLGVMGPAGLPASVRAKLSAALVEIVRDPDTQARLRTIGFEPVGTDAAAFDRFYRAEMKRWADFVKERGIKATQ
jgi:tripartite-type tricarboxylate transporter receptor subunit TctC